MHGGTCVPSHYVDGDTGLSPHARGNQNCRPTSYASTGPIPACTGEPQGQCIGTSLAGAYPRMHGGTLDYYGDPMAMEGLSPHARGNPASACAASSFCGPIPACTGEPLTFSLYLSHVRAYPRMHGGTSAPDRIRLWIPGLSPHARGNRSATLNASSGKGPIPACTGEPQ